MIILLFAVPVCLAGGIILGLTAHMYITRLRETQISGKDTKRSLRFGPDVGVGL